MKLAVAQIIEYKGKKIIYMDFSNCDRRKMVEIVEGIKPLIEEQPLNSALTLVNVDGLVFNTDILKAFKEFTEHNKPYVKTGAVVGIKGIQKIAYDAVMRFSERNLPLFETIDEAKEWLVQQ
jgi:hypothetical protein